MNRQCLNLEIYTLNIRIIKNYRKLKLKNHVLEKIKIVKSKLPKNTNRFLAKNYRSMYFKKLFNVNF